MVRVLIVGATGQLGQALYRCRPDLSDVVTAARGQADIVVDLERIGEMRQAVITCRPDIVINCAAMTNVQACEENPELAMRINGYGVGALANICTDIGARLIHISSDHIFDGAGSLPYTEQAVPHPCNVYARSKLYAERLLEGRENVLVLRTNFISPLGSEARSWGRWAMDSLRQLTPIKGFTDVMFNAVDSVFLAHAIWHLALYHPKSSAVLNIAAADVFSKYEFLCHLADAAGLNAALIEPALMPQSSVRRPHFMALDASRFCRLTGISLPRRDEIVARILHHHYGPEFSF